MKSFRLTRVLLSLNLMLMASMAMAQDEVDFAKQIKPILEKHCISCHGPEEENSFRIDIREDALAYVEPDSPDDSDLYQALISDDEDVVMPPPDFERQMNDEQKELIKNWIQQGAVWPEDVKLVPYVPEVEIPVLSSADSEVKREPAQDDSPPVADSTIADSETVAEPSGDATPEKPAKTDPKTQRIFNAIGSLHAAAIHLPIGLLLAAGLFALLGIRGNFVMSDCAYYCLWLGMLGAIAASVSGWYFSPMEKRGTVEVFADLWNQDHKVFWHRSGALAMTLFSVILVLFAASARSKTPDEGVMWKLGTILLAAGIGWVGHTGGELHYPADHYKDLNALINDLMSGNKQDPAVEPAPVEKKPEAAKSDDDSDAAVIGFSTQWYVVVPVQPRPQVHWLADDFCHFDADV